jgi:ubiquinone/menaquinone biosynthesis C-methylase UbiE
LTSIFKAPLGKVAGGLVLDVATGLGGSTGVLRKYLASFSHIIGVDNRFENVQAAHSDRGDDLIHFAHMDAGLMGFAETCFDTVFIANSLHHINDVPAVLSEMKRVLKPGGKFIISEIHRDAQSESQYTVVLLHHWIAAVDTASGIVHNKTYHRKEIIDFVSALELSKVDIHDRVYEDKDPIRTETIRRYEAKYIDRFIRRARETPGSQKLVQIGLSLRKRLHEIGIQTKEPLILLIGEK